MCDDQIAYPGVMHARARARAPRVNDFVGERLLVARGAEQSEI